MTMADTLPGKTRFKSNSLAKSSNVPIFGRTRAMAGLQKQAARMIPQLATPTNFPKLRAFLSSYVWPWVCNYLKTAFHGKYKRYPAYAGTGDSGIYRLASATSGGPIKLSLAGDWGTGTEESWQIAQAMGDGEPDYTIHLGDVYYVGDLPEVNENFLGIPGGQYTPVQWPTGAVGEFAMIGNHEMYGGGEPYFTRILPTLRTGTGQRQKASFFALETDHWRIIALDTGYNSVGLPILGSIPGIKKIPFVGANCRIPDEVIDWLRNTVKPRQNPKPTLLLSHHQYYSAFQEETFGLPAKQLSEFFTEQNIVWIWGHEHRLAIYDLYSPDGRIHAYGRCLGHGGMPVEDAKPANGKVPLAFWDPRNDYPLDDHSTAGWNGYVNVLLDGPKMTLEYLDIKKTSLFVESFAGSSDGSLAYSYQQPATRPRLERPNP